MKFFILLWLLISINSFAEDDHHDHHHDHHHEEHEKKEKKSLDAHVHGVSTLKIVQDNNKLSFEFEMPGFDVVGFEYKAKKKEDIKKVKNALKVLSDYTNMLHLSETAKCTEDKNSARVINEGSHSEFMSEYILNCKNITQLKELKIEFFKSFEYSKKLNIELVSKNKTMSYQMDRLNNSIDVKNFFND